MTARRLFLGVDGGGTKTEFVCIDDTGAAIARALTGTTYHLQVGLDGAIAALAQGVGDICRVAGITPDDLDHSFFGLPAFGEDAAIDPLLERACGHILRHDRYACGNDMICGWAGSLGCADGINLVAGTGSIGYGERHGRAARIGGWGELLGDEGSAYWIAIQGLNAFTRMSDGRRPRGALHAAFRAHFDLRDDLDLCAHVMGEHGLSRDAIAALAPIVSAAAEAGDAAAHVILDQAGEDLMAMAAALRSALGYEPGEVTALSWSGGVLTREPTVQHALRQRLDAAGAYRIVAPRHDPGVGAALYARHLAARKIAPGAAS